MINSLIIDQFQSHKHSEIEFDPGLNIITGSSDAGKSAIIRSLLWVITNRPSGEDFKNWDSKDPVKVTIYFDDGEISKERDKGKNSYEIESGKLESIRSDVPEEIQNITKITDFNIQTQHQSYFLLQDSPGEVARKLNELVGLDIIDRLYKNINSKITDTKSRIKYSSERILDLETSIENLASIDEISKIVSLLDTMTTEVEIVENRCVSVRNLIQSINEIKSKIESQKKILKFESRVAKLKEKIEEKEQLITDNLKLTNLVTSIKKVSESYQSEIEWLSIESKYNGLSDKITELKKLEHKQFLIGKNIKAYKVLSVERNTQKEILSAKVSQYLILLKKHNICPTCGSKIDSIILNQIKEGFCD
jgi:DNA repair protein SbcC/Rad50